MSADPKHHGLLTGKIYARMMQFLDEEDGDVKPVDVIRWWAFWEAVCPADIWPGRLFWASLVATVRLRSDPGKSQSLFVGLEDWLIGDDDTHVDIIRLDGGDEPSPN